MPDTKSPATPPEPRLDRRRARAAESWALNGELVLIGAGEPVGIPGGGDQTYPFRAHPEYVYLAGRDVPEAVLAFDPRDGWTDFVPEPTERERFWEGRTDVPGTPLTSLAAWLASRRGRSIVSLGVRLPGVRGDSVRRQELRMRLAQVRLAKDEVELARMRSAARATVAGYAAARRAIRPGATERAVQIEMESEFFRNGADACAYDSIVAAGAHAAVLHWPPTATPIGGQDVVLIDAGASVERYGVDVTRTYPADAEHRGFTRELFELVRSVHGESIAACRPGVSYVDVHLLACRRVVEGLLALGILTGNVESLLEREAYALFFPHGVGHPTGLGVRDAGPDLPRKTSPRSSTMRAQIELQPDFTITIEPGVYFIAPLLQDPARRQRFRDAVSWDRVDPLIGTGGVRIEDTVRITEGEPENLTSGVAM